MAVISKILSTSAGISCLGAFTWLTGSCGAGYDVLLAGAAALAINIRGLVDLYHPFVYGYGACLAAFGVYSMVHLLANAPSYALSIMLDSRVVQSVLYIAYGVRLTTYLFYRNNYTAYFNLHVAAQKGGQRETGCITAFASRLGSTIGMSCLMSYYYLPLLFLNQAYLKFGSSAFVDQSYFRKAITTTEWIGHIVCASGIIIQTIADYQKSKAKAQRPYEPVMDGLYYSLCRHPNYFGEMLFHSGVLLGAAGGLVLDWKKAVVGSFSPLMCLSVIINSTEVLEASQMAKYSTLVEYQRYTRSTACVVPLPGCYKWLADRSQTKLKQDL